MNTGQILKKMNRGCSSPKGDLVCASLLVGGMGALVSGILALILISVWKKCYGPYAAFSDLTGTAGYANCAVLPFSCILPSEHIRVDCRGNATLAEIFAAEADANFQKESLPALFFFGSMVMPIAFFCLGAWVAFCCGYAQYKQRTRAGELGEPLMQNAVYVGIDHEMKSVEMDVVSHAVSGANRVVV